MNKTKLTVSVLASLMACATLAGCGSVKAADDGYVLTFTDSSGKVTQVKADDVFEDYLKDSSGVKTMFDSVYELLIRNNEYTSDEKDEIERVATNKVNGVKSTAKSNKETNGTKYDDEFDALLSSYGVDDEAELKEHFKYEEMKSIFETNFYKDHLDGIKDGSFFKDEMGITTKGGYLNEMLPYHVKHILVNVDASDGTHYNGEISENNAEKLAEVAKLLAEGTKGHYDFGKIASEFSDDTGSKAAYGDLGIMDKSTSYVNEFKLGVYVYDALYGHKDKAASLNIPEASLNAIETMGIGEIPYAVFEELDAVKDVTNSNNASVNDGKAFFYPRNIYFNKYLNSHLVSVVVANDLPTADQLYQPKEDGTLDTATSEAYVGAANNEYAALEGFQTKLTINGVERNVLTDESGNVILVVRAGSSYQGVHFIAVEKSALDTTDLAKYYTTKYPGQEGYPEDIDHTYVTIRNDTTATYKTRAESVETSIKNYDSLLNTYIYEYFAKKQNVTFTEKGKTIGDAISKYISSKRQKATDDEVQNWNKTWSEYVEYLDQQQKERCSGKLLSATCAINYKKVNASDNGFTDAMKKAYEYGGMCSYVK